ncbi:SIR2 family protein [Neomoorella thermoacetica]|uniref:SIR2 family protein n=1 Tax=Neomoorella thermoacetica TaxID=1525 RepID=UPI0008FA556C|nr:SIR2 family protein [Moorella thermoacetica]OIQ10364.1 hypothetical protein MOOTH_27360 [Moorella thermoacetica]
MIDPLLSLAFSMHSCKGVYALLLGSGISSSAGILTGWQIVLDLIRKLAHSVCEDCGDDPAAWYRDSFGEDPDYAKILECITRSPEDRNSLLRRYFEPSKEEQEQGLKLPTDAHKAIAELVAKGYVRVIITTNFDRLLERAIEAAGVVPSVISTPDAVEGAMPLAHTDCTIVKVHGDYLDTRIKNTPAELSQYDERMNRLLDQVFDEYGLVVCGWSAEWDTALRAALERCSSHRFTTFWAARGEPKEAARRLINLRLAEVIRIRDADSFFRELADKVSALEEVDRPHPLSAKVAAATLKKYLPEERHKIRLHDLVMGEARKLYDELSEDRFSLNTPFTDQEFINRVQRYEALTEILQAMMITGCYWGEEKHIDRWVKCLELIANPPGERYILTDGLDLRYYPALLLFYSGGIATVAAQRYKTFAALLTQPRVFFQEEVLPPVLILYPQAVKEELAKRLPGMSNSRTPLNEHIYNLLREPFKEFLPQERLYEECFDRFEYLFALVHADLHEKRGHLWGPIGCFRWRSIFNPQLQITKVIETEIQKMGANWPPLKAGLFDGSLERFNYIKAEFDQFIKRW